MNKLSGIIGAASLAAVLLVHSSPVEAGMIQCDVPFSFQIGERTLPPGVYLVNSDHAVLFVRGLNRGAVGLTSRVSSGQATEPKLVFHKYGDEYILHEAWTGGTSGYALLRSRRERQLGDATRRNPKAARLERIVIPAL